METFEWRFPNYMELCEKFDLGNLKNKDLKYKIDLMYKEYSKLYAAMRSMSPEKIRFQEKHKRPFRGTLIINIGDLEI